MKKIFLFAVVACTLHIGCEKATDESNEEQIKDVIVKQVDGICGDAIFEIMDANYKSLGEQNFEYKGVVYNGVFGTTIACANLTPVSYNDTNPNNKYYKVTISKSPLNNCNVAICMATLSKMPNTRLYIK
ncbi:MAG: hypothetical protein ACOVNY_03305 [Chitinophagaceae bacterium]